MLDVPAPLEHQLPAFEAPIRFKLLRAGRRGGKTRLMFTAAVIGHGPLLADGTPMFKALAQGLDVFWILPEIPQARTIWEEEIRPRFDGVRGAKVREHPKFSAKVAGMGTLYVISAVPKAIKSVRGAGKKLGGVIIDEAAWLDLAHAWNAVIRPALVDNHGWAIIASTTNSGHDGNHGDDGSGNRLLPSCFNRWCTATRAGTMGDEWGEFHFTGYDNPEIDESEMDALANGYTEGSVKQLEEVFAELLTAGAGLAFPEYDKLLIERKRAPAAWDRVDVVGGLDWGYASPGAAYVLEIARSGQHVRLAAEVYFNGPWRPDFKAKKTPFEVGVIIAKTWQAAFKAKQIRAMPDMVHCDSACFAVPDGHESIAARIQSGMDSVLGEASPMLVPAPKGPGSRATRKLIVHDLIKVVRDETGAVMDGPVLEVGADCPHWRRTVPSLPVDPNQPDDVDTDAEDHAHDAWTYAMMAVWPDGQRPSQSQLAAEEQRKTLDALSRREAVSHDAPVTKRKHTGRVLGRG